MSFNTERKAIETRFKNNWNETVCPIAWENVAFVPPPGSPYCRFKIKRGKGSQISLGTNPYSRWVNLIIVTLFAPEGTGTGIIAALAANVQSIFQNQTFLTEDNNSIKCRTTSVNDIGIVGGFLVWDITTTYLRDDTSGTPFVPPPAPARSLTHAPLSISGDGKTITFSDLPANGAFLVIINGMVQVTDWVQVGTTLEFPYSVASFEVYAVF